MDLQYLIDLSLCETSSVKIRLRGKRTPDQKKLLLFIPGPFRSGREVNYFEAFDGKGKRLFYEREGNRSWFVYWNHSEFKSKSREYEVNYLVSFSPDKELQSEIHHGHAHLKLSEMLLRPENEIEGPQIQFKFPPLWSKISTLLPDVSETRDHFIYESTNYGELVKDPIEIGCHETDGFLVQGIPHLLSLRNINGPKGGDLLGEIKNSLNDIAEDLEEIWGTPKYKKFHLIQSFCKSPFQIHRNQQTITVKSDGLFFHYPEGKSECYLRLLHAWQTQWIGPITSELEWIYQGIMILFSYEILLKKKLISEELYLKHLSRHIFHLQHGDELKRAPLHEFLWAGNKSKAWALFHSSFMTFVLELMKAKVSKNQFISLLKKSNTYAELTQKIPLKVEEILTRLGQTTEDKQIEELLPQIGLKMEEEEKKVSLFQNRQWRQNGQLLFFQELTHMGDLERAGLKTGDEIIGVNGLRIKGQDKKSLIHLLRSCKTVHFFINREGALLELRALLGHQKGNTSIKKSPDSLLWSKFQGKMRDLLCN